MAKWALGVKASVAFKWCDTGELRTRKEDKWSELCVTISASDGHSGSSCKQQSSGASSGNLSALQKDTPANINPPCPSARILTEETINANDTQTSVCTFTSDYALDFCSGRISLWLFCWVFIETGCLLVKSHKPYLAQCKCKGKGKSKVDTAKVCCKSIKENPLHIILPLCYYMKSSEGLCFITFSFLVGIDYF